MDFFHISKNLVDQFIFLVDVFTVDVIS